MAETYSMDEEKKEDNELSFGQRPEATYRDFEDSESKPKNTTRERFNDKFIKTEKGSLARRGSVTARRAENREAARNRAKQAALKRRNK